MKALRRYTLGETTRIGHRIRTWKEGAVFTQVDGFLPRGATVLEVGAGRGEFAQMVLERGFRYVGIEPSESLRESLLARGLEIIGEPVPEIELPDGSVDLVYSSQVIEHLETPSIVMKFYLEAYRVLKLEGVICSVAPNYDLCGPIFHLYEYQHSYITNRGRLEQLCRDSGFEVVSSRCFLTRLGLTRWWLVDRIFSHLALTVMRNMTVHSVLRSLLRTRNCFRLYKNLFDQVLVVGRKRNSEAT